MLRQYGNAVDAVVTVGFVLAVTYFQADNLGGGFMPYVDLADRGDRFSRDGRCRAPRAQCLLVRSPSSPLASGASRTVAGLTLAFSRRGLMNLMRVMQPAVRLLEYGFIVN
ncbi:gamma-glutamyltransferase [Sodalis sp.]|uniref:gamma-glutamyltransferase n=1 Tax=Sodalis sp. (in: enterobacteria) TaxID=1898979 RepID=UPI003872F217